MSEDIEYIDDDQDDLSLYIDDDDLDYISEEDEDFDIDII